MAYDTTYTVHELAQLSGVSVRTLHHYDELHLVQAQRGKNNYRRYGSAEVDRLQQVLLYRECGMALADIKRLLDSPAFDAASALGGHLCELRSQQKHIEGLIASVEKTLACMKGNEPMKDEEKFQAFKKDLIGENEKKYGEEVRERWGDAAADASNAKVMGMSEEQYQRTQGLEAQMKEALLAGMETGDAAGSDAQRAADLHRQWLCNFWKDGTYSKEAHRGLTEAYVADERFKVYYEAVAPGAAAFLRDAVKVYTA